MTRSNKGSLAPPQPRTNQQPEATPSHRKVETKHVQFKDPIDITVFRINDIYFGERDTSNLAWRIKNRAIPNDGSASSHCLCRPRYRLKNVERTERSADEAEKWQRILDKAETDARIRAVQMHFENISRLHYALPTTISCSEPEQARRPTAALPAKFYADSPARKWIYDTGAGMAAIGKAYLTKAERSQIYSVDGIEVSTAAGKPDSHLLWI